MNTSLFLIIPVTLLLSGFATALIYKYGARMALVDKPNERSSHVVPTPRSGGVGIWLAFVVAGIFVPKELVFILIAGAIGLLGILEDILNLSTKIRLTAQMIISAITIAIFLSIPLSAEKIILFIFWLLFIVGTLNFYNFMDGINGIAAFTGIVGFGLLAAFSSLIVKDSFFFLMSIVLMLACLSFLPFNFPKAKVFMGDVGSVFLGFVYASFVLRLSSDFAVFLCLIMFLCTFYADSIVTIFYRWRRGENLTKAHRSHLYQYLSNELMLPHWVVSVAYALLQFIVGLLSIWAYQTNIALQIGLLSFYVITFVIAYNFIKSMELRKL